MPQGWQRPPFSICMFSKSSYISAGVTADCSLSDPSALNRKREKKKIQCTLWFPVRYRKYTQIIFRCKPFAAAAQGVGMESFGQAWTPVCFLCPRRDHYGAGMREGVSRAPRVHLPDNSSLYEEPPRELGFSEHRGFVSSSGQLGHVLRAVLTSQAGKLRLGSWSPC